MKGEEEIQNFLVWAVWEGGPSRMGDPGTKSISYPEIVEEEEVIKRQKINIDLIKIMPKGRLSIFYVK